MLRTFYFAYGSNMASERLMNRVYGPVDVLRTHVLQNYSLNFNCSGYANIVPEQNSFVEGVIYALSPRQLKELDHYEMLYHREYFLIPEGVVVVYIADYSNSNQSLPEDHYLTILKKGCLEHKLHHTFAKLQTQKVQTFFQKKKKRRKYENLQMDFGKTTEY